MESAKKKRRSKNSFLILLVIDLFLFLLLCATIAGGFFAAKVFAQQVKETDEAKVQTMYAKAEQAEKVNIPNALRSYTAERLTDQEAIPAYSVSEIYNLDLREPSGVTAADLELVTSDGLVGLEEAFVNAEEKYGVNCVFLMSIASLESAKGTQMFRPNNMFGYGQTGFSSKAEGINVVAKGLSTRYLDPSGSLYGGSPTVKGVNKRYAANPQWYVKVANYMEEYYSVISQRHNEALDAIN
ncbi:glucosaminidase domain-containing protein [Zhenpiania hominis]|uniref:Glucosaminidase domain-containing protein n=1 Tax=Zhenpiania hominis TaxID=2763644 RepID=A0A923NN41_9FIRM|nr:glucosaminidase domain-containing protein [Zhenpiania hominis]MBC6680192.1 glucosaminidase domain-containing protein [Zhenpiania hominis]